MITLEENGTMSADRSQRLLEMINTIQNQPRMSAEELIDHCGVSRRTFFRDIKLIQQSGVPLRHLPGSGYEIDPVFDIDACRLNADHLRGLGMLRDLTRHLPESSINTAAIEALDRVLHATPATGNTVVDHFTRTLAFDISVDATNTNPFFNELALAIEQALSLNLQLNPTQVDDETCHVSCNCLPISLIWRDHNWLLLVETATDQDLHLIPLQHITAVQSQPRAQASTWRRNPAHDHLTYACVLLPTTMSLPASIAVTTQKVLSSDSNLMLLLCAFNDASSINELRRIAGAIIINVHSQTEAT